MIETNDDDNDEPFFRVRYITDKPIEDEDGYWEEYYILNKSWFRLCDECIEEVCTSAESLCASHYNKENKPKKKTINMKKKTKRLITNVKKKRNIKPKLPLKTIIEDKTEESLDEEMNESSGIVISVSLSLNKKQTSQVKEFIAKFHNDSQSIQLTCESQPDYIDDTTTHVITSDFGSFSTILTKQIIQACVRHIFIGSIDWILSSLEQSCILDHFPYEILRDNKSLSNTRGIKQCRFDQLPVFPSSYVLSAECHVGIKQFHLTRDELTEIIELSGATLLNDYIEYQNLIILCNTKKEMMKRKKLIDDNDKEIYYCRPAFLFDSIVRHEIQAIKKYLW